MLNEGDGMVAGEGGGMKSLLSPTDRRGFLIRSVGFGGAAVLSGGFLAACGSKPAGSTGTGSGTTGGGGTTKDTVRLAMLGPVAGFDPQGPSQGNVQSLQAINACCDSLISFRVPKDIKDINSVNDSIHPQLAESWKISDDGKVFDFKLREGVMSPFGNEMTSDDVVWSLQRAVSTESAAQVHFALNNVTKPDQIKANGKYGVTITTPLQYRLLPQLGLFWFPIFDSVEAKKHATADDKWAAKWLDKNMCGFGPYEITRFSPGGANVTFTARDDYWGEKPTKTILYTTVTSAATSLQLLLTGGADYAESLTPVQLARLNGKAASSFLPSNNGAVFFLTYDPPFDDIKIRAAIAKALPYETIVKAIYKGLPGVEPNKSILSPIQDGHTDEFGYETDMAAAKAGLAGIKGQKLEFVYNATVGVAQQISVAIQAALNEAGLDVSIRALPEGQFSTEVREGKWPSSVNTNDFPSYMDPLYAFNQIMTPDGRINFSGYDSKEAVAFIDTMEKDPTSPELIKQGQQLAMRDLPQYPLVWTGDHRGVAAGLDIMGGHSASAVVYFQDLRWT
jgi:peptide/nickel transport system substrate-binding protein